MAYTFIGRLGITREVPILHCDGQSAIQSAQNPIFHSKNKHIEVKNHFIKESLEDMCIRLVKVHTDDDPSDLLVKILSCKISLALKQLY